MVAFDNLPVEIYLEISESLHYNDQITLYCVCRHMREVFASIIYRDIRITNEYHLLTLLRTLIQHKHFSSYVRSAYVVIAGDKIDCPLQEDYPSYSPRKVGQLKKKWFDSPNGKALKEISDCVRGRGFTKLMHQALLSGGIISQTVLLLTICDKLEQLTVHTHGLHAFKWCLVELLKNGNLSQLKRLTFTEESAPVLAHDHPLPPLLTTLKRKTYPSGFIRFQYLRSRFSGLCIISRCPF